MVDSITFDETAFENFLKQKNVFTFQYSKGRYTYDNKRLSKIYSDNEQYAIILETRRMYVDDLKGVTLGRNNEPEPIAIYFSDIDKLVFDSSYEMNPYQTVYPNRIMFEKNSLYTDIMNLINEECLNRKEIFMDQYRNDIEEIEAKTNDNANSIYNAAVTGEKREVTFMSKQNFERIRNFDMIYQYLKNGQQFITSFVDAYVEENQSLIKAISLYMLAEEKKMEELENYSYIQKAKKIYELLKGELKEAKNLWGIKANGEKKKVENYLFITSAEIKIGRSYSERIDIEDIVAIGYGKKVYSL